MLVSQLRRGCAAVVVIFIQHLNHHGTPEAVRRRGKSEDEEEEEKKESERENQSLRTFIHMK